jgi:hypothetical protein
MGFYSQWQPLVDEDRHTALVFGFFRHAPVALGLAPWLSGVLGRPVAPHPLEPASFWPALPSTSDGQAMTVPELVFDATDSSGELKVVIEVKPGSDMHRLDQIRREALDAAERSGTARVVVVMVGADLAPPASTADWPAELAHAAASRRVAVEIETAYSSFALIGETIAAAGQTDDAWKPYADDVVAQLKRKGLLGYGGAPMLDDLEVLTLRNAVEAFNRIIASARQFHLQLHADSRFHTSGLQPDLGAPSYTSPRMLRDGRTDQIGQPEASFKTKVILSLYTHPDLNAQTRIFVAFDLIAHESSEIQLLAGRMTYTAGQPHDTRRLAAALISPRADPSTPDLPYIGETSSSTWRYDRRPWQPNRAADDITWALTRTAQALQA